MEDNKQIQDFVYSVLDQIKSGIEMAQNASEHSTYVVNPGNLVIKDHAGVLSLSKMVLYAQK